MKPVFLKNERALSKNTIDKLYQSGARIHSRSFTLIWNKAAGNASQIRLLISVPKKNIKKSVDRNYVKRIVRESYKTNKSLIYNLILIPIETILVYNKSTLPEFNKLKVELLTLFEVLHKKIYESNQ